MQRALIDFFDLNANFAQLADDAIAVFGIAVSDFQFAFRDCGRSDESSGFDSIGNDRVLRATETFDARNLNRRRARATHARAHFVEQFRKISYFRFARGIVNRGNSTSERRRHHQVFGAGDGNLIEADFCAD